MLPHYEVFIQANKYLTRYFAFWRNTYLDVLDFQGFSSESMPRADWGCADAGGGEQLPIGLCLFLQRSWRLRSGNTSGASGSDRDVEDIANSLFIPPVLPVL